eukprot:SAG31_NODE_3949_length_3725_cov_1.821566_6_plen_139_part_00
MDRQEQAKEEAAREQNRALAAVARQRILDQQEKAKHEEEEEEEAEATKAAESATLAKAGKAQQDDETASKEDELPAPAPAEPEPEPEAAPSAATRMVSDVWALDQDDADRDDELNAALSRRRGQPLSPHRHCSVGFTP